MLRISRSSGLRRQLSTSPFSWNISRPPTTEPGHEQSKPEFSSSQLPDPPDVVKVSSPSAAEPKIPQSPKSPSLSSYDVEIAKQRIREWTQQAAIVLRNRADDFTATTKATFSQLGSELNRVTGYEEIEALKRDVVEQERCINVARQAARQAKTSYEEAVIQRSNSQREVNDLLQRKSSWTDQDVGRFTTLVRQDHLYEQEELRAKSAVNESEDAVEREFSQLMRTILARYHEEQVWSDKIRSASTYGSLAALGLNMLVFIVAIIVVEPWKRRRLAQTFERKVEELSRENAALIATSMQTIGGHIARQEDLLEFLKTEVSKKAEMVQILREPVVAGTKEPEDVVAIDKPVDDSRQRSWEIVVVGAGAFALGILSSVLLSR
ncbi:hypothetical protein BYT27DRAFT_7176978 [Phlegmacium glaucopus]|nr:hypothetical protein BYT27DRAFT_7176978 [Phlegmacium glaucopus]